MTQERHGGLAPAMLAEQQRARTEIEAALTIAAHRPRDQKLAMDRILTSCQRPGLAAKAKFRYSRGGTDIEGVTIDLMEVVAQMWGNLDFGFRELARFPGVAGGPGESTVEAFAWDLETNVKRKVQFTVQHAERTKKGLRIITDPRDIYEWIANQAQRRVRTCLENIIPRDIYETAAEECEKTMRANVGDLKEAVAKLIPAFAQFGVTREMLEARLQRRIETISAAQVVYLRTIWTGLRDGVSHPEDFFDLTLGEKKAEEAPKSAAEQAKEKMRQAARPAGNSQQDTAPKPATTVAPQPAPQPAAQPKEATGNADYVAGVRAALHAGAQPGEVREYIAADQTIDEATRTAAIAVVDEVAPGSQPTGTEAPPAESDVDRLYEDYASEAAAAETLTGLRELRKHADANDALKAHPDTLSRVHRAISAAEDAIRNSRGGRSNMK